MHSAAVWTPFLVVVGYATAGCFLPWPEPRDLWRVCSILGIAARRVRRPDLAGAEPSGHRMTARPWRLHAASWCVARSAGW
jgi:hypothetical protein